jgi:hypothetical protein
METVIVKCSSCGKETVIAFTEDEMARMPYDKDKVNSTFPNHDAFERRLLATGKCDACHEKAFKEPWNVGARCPKCGLVNVVTVEKADYDKFAKRQGHAAELFPYLSASEREILITGICGKCWDELFKEEDGEEI